LLLLLFFFNIIVCIVIKWKIPPPTIFRVQYNYEWAYQTNSTAEPLDAGQNRVNIETLSEPANHGRTVFIHQHQKILKQPLEPRTWGHALFYV
jgi:hypothetical protein